jgi:hypothetical protein
MKRVAKAVAAELRAAYRSLGARETAAVLALAAVSIGCAMERLSLGLIVPGTFVLACLLVSHLRGAD